jgi:S-adenosylmethionine hydrolase
MTDPADWPIVTLTTDFGVGSPYVAEMKGVILGLNPRVHLVDISHSVTPQDIRQGAWILRQATRQFPPGTVHVAVVDPGVGSERGVLLARFDGQDYVAPDNGVLGLVAGEAESREVLLLDRPAYWRERLSHTFHGRDIMAPVAAQLSRGTPASAMGSPVADWVELEFPRARHEREGVSGEIVVVDSFGNLVSNLSEQDLAPHGVPQQPPVVRLGDGVSACFVRHYSQGKPGDCVALIGSGGHLEVAIVNGHAARVLGLGVGSRIVVRGSGAGQSS